MSFLQGIRELISETGSTLPPPRRHLGWDRTEGVPQRRLAARAGRPAVRITDRMKRHALEIAAYGSHQCRPFPVPNPFARAQEPG